MGFFEGLNPKQVLLNLSTDISDSLKISLIGSSTCGYIFLKNSLFAISYTSSSSTFSNPYCSFKFSYCDYKTFPIFYAFFVTSSVTLIVFEYITLCSCSDIFFSYVAFVHVYLMRGSLSSFRTSCRYPCPSSLMRNFANI